MCSSKGYLLGCLVIALVGCAPQSRGAGATTARTLTEVIATAPTAGSGQRSEEDAHRPQQAPDGSPQSEPDAPPSPVEEPAATPGPSTAPPVLPEVPEELLATDEASLGELPRVLRLYAVHSKETLALPVYEDGRVPESHLQAMERFFRCRRTGETHTISPGVLRALYAIEHRFPGRVIEVVSGYRKNHGVRGSKHFAGRAIDLRVRGVALTRVRDFLWRHVGDLGLGYYGHQNFLHVDYRPEERDTAWTSPSPDAPYQYRPRWATRIRPPWRAPRPLRETNARSLSRAVLAISQRRGG